jgi:hypothetical protein
MASSILQGGISRKLKKNASWGHGSRSMIAEQTNAIQAIVLACWGVREKKNDLIGLGLARGAIACVCDSCDVLDSF